MTLLFPSPGEREKQESAMKPRLTVHDLHGTNQQISQSSSPPSVKDHHQHKSIHQMNLLRSFPLLLLVIYTSAVILIRFFSSDSYNSLHPSVVSEVPRSELEILIKTRVSSKQISLQANEEKERLITPPICQTLIDGKSEVTALGMRKDDMTGVMCCDRRHHRTDVCYMKGDVRTNPRSLSILLYNSDSEHTSPEKIRPYTRKWETPIMSTIDELTLVPVSNAGPTFNATGKCEVNHKVPAVVLSTGGYTGNVYHEFNDGLIPLYLTTERFDREVVLVILEYHPWWMMKYETVVKKLSNYDVVDFRRDRRIHCFPEMIVGMRIHGELSVDPQLIPTGKGIQDFQSLLFQSFESNHATTTPQQQHPLPQTITSQKPKLVIFIRTRSRVILNLHAIIRRCKRTGFDVEILNPKRNTPLSEIHTILSTSTVMVAVHGAAMTHFLFLRPKAVLIQVVPLGLDWAADEYYGQPARKLGLEYVEYKVRPVESSLTKEYGLTDPVVSDPSAVTRRGWQETKRIYLEHQNVTLDVRRFGKVVGRAYSIVGGKYKLYKKESR